MAVALIAGICNLFPEFFADALILLCSFQTAGTVTAGSFQTVFYHLNHFLIFIESYCHCQHFPFGA